METRKPTSRFGRSVLFDSVKDTGSVRYNRFFVMIELFCSFMSDCTVKGYTQGEKSKNDDHHADPIIATEFLVGADAGDANDNQWDTNIEYKFSHVKKNKQN